MAQTWFITGSSRGLGRSLTQAVLANGENVIATARNPQQLDDLVAQYPEQILQLKLDVTDAQQVQASVATAITHFGRIDILVNNAGAGIAGAAEAFTEGEVRSQMELNLYAPIAITRAVLPYMRKQRAGRILQISSIGGRLTSTGLSIYQSAKFGLSGFSEALAKEVAPLGIYVTSVEPGGFRTNWGGNSMTFAKEVEGYETTATARMAEFRNGEFQPKGDPDKAAQVLLQIAAHPAPPVHLVLGSDAVNGLKHADAIRQTEFEKWLSVSLSTDEDVTQ
jgi:NAD(P)-dependent dehydrogenase (short-subunit alcohol dehydrogenase family)